jgi:hypothetical protein
MCTISIVPFKEKLFFTFNRDEHPARQTPEYITKEKNGDKEIVFAKDVKGGGTWFVIDNKGNVAMLFNGGYVKHEKKTDYQQSRGLLLLTIAKQPNMLAYFETIALENIEPFSIILYEQKKMYRLIWNGSTKEVVALSLMNPHIFSSATIYTKEVQDDRKVWLNQYLNNNPQPDMFHFHCNYKKEDAANGLILKRNELLQTLSVSQAQVGNGEVCIQHFDVLQQKFYNDKLICV